MPAELLGTHSILSEDTPHQKVNWKKGTNTPQPISEDVTETRCEVSVRRSRENTSIQKESVHGRTSQANLLSNSLPSLSSPETQSAGLGSAEATTAHKATLESYGMHREKRSQSLGPSILQGESTASREAQKPAALWLTPPGLEPPHFHLSSGLTAWQCSLKNSPLRRNKQWRRERCVPPQGVSTWPRAAGWSPGSRAPGPLSPIPVSRDPPARSTRRGSAGRSHATSWQ